MMYSVYILECSDHSYYTGIAKDLEKRMLEHSGDQKGAIYTRGRRPVKLVYFKECKDKSEALKEEIRIKKLNRQGKEKLVIQLKN